MSKSVLDSAKKLIRRRKFSLAITLLESRAEIYEDDFDFYLTLGIACLYVGDYGGASRNFGLARKIKFFNSDLILGQAVIYLRRGETDRAVQYYLEVLDIDPNNQIAKDALEFIKSDGDFTNICKMVDSGKIERFYPPLGVNPDVIRNCILAGVFAGIIVSAAYIFVPRQKNNLVGPRANLESLALTAEEIKEPQAKDLSNTVVNYIMDSASINKSFNNALQYFQDERDNACQVEINRLLNSNASLSIKHKASVLMSFIKVPTFDSLNDNYSYAQVASDPRLYLDCYVAWSGRISNVNLYENGAWSCDLLVGYENQKTVEGIVNVRFAAVPQPEIDNEKPVRFLGKITFEDDKIVLDGIAVFQSIYNKS